MTYLHSALPAVEGGLDQAALAAEVREYLSRDPRQLPSKALYDNLGSALFDAICELPWYPITRAEKVLIASSREEILGLAGNPTVVIELGPGNGEKLELLLSGSGTPRRVQLVDVSAAALGTAYRRMRDLPGIDVTTHAALYEIGLADALSTRPDDAHALVIFLGSNIGNFDPPGAARFLRTVRRTVAPGDMVLLGADLVKPEAALMAAYDDPLGVTAAFNRNLLVRLNRDLGADFVLDRFAHQARWNAGASRVEMHLVSRLAQRVHIPVAGVDLQLAARETIWTESSYKYELTPLSASLGSAGFEVVGRWVDEESRFALLLCRAG